MHKTAHSIHFKVDLRTSRKLFKIMLCGRPHWGALEKINKLKKKWKLKNLKRVYQKSSLF